MQGRKIYHLLELLSEEDQEQFTLYLDSPYHNSSKILSVFWNQWLKKVIRSDQGAELTAEEFVKGSSLKISRFDKLCSQLYTRAKDFLLLRAFEEKTILKEIMFSSAVLDRDQNLDTAMGLAKKTSGYLNKQLESPEKYLAQLYHSLEIASAQIRTRKPAGEFQSEFSGMLDLLDQFAESKGMQLSVAALNIGRIIQQKDNSINELLEARIKIEEREEPRNILAKIYFLILRLQLNYKTSEALSQFLAIMESNWQKIEEDVVNDVYNFTLNFCIRRLNEGDKSFLNHSFELYVQLLGNGLLLEQGKLYPQQYKNMVVAGCRAGELEWVENFIAGWADLLTDDHDGIARTYNQAILLFHQTRYREAIHKFKEVIQGGSHDIFYGMDARMYLWKAYFEYLEHLSPEEIDEMYKLYDSVRLYIDRHKKISTQHKTLYRNFVRLFKRFMFLLLDQGVGRSSDDLRDFHAELLAAEDMPNKAWFVLKVEEVIAT